MDMTTHRPMPDPALTVHSLAKQVAELESRAERAEETIALCHDGLNAYTKALRSIVAQIEQARSRRDRAALEVAQLESAVAQLRKKAMSLRKIVEWLEEQKAIFERQEQDRMQRVLRRKDQIDGADEELADGGHGR